MAYTRDNYLKRVNSIVAVYNSVKQPDIPDTRIVKNIFPQHNIFISYRMWMIYKGLKQSTYKQATLFD